MAGEATEFTVGPQHQVATKSALIEPLNIEGEFFQVQIALLMKWGGNRGENSGKPSSMHGFVLFH
jgi:hypothetical protein